MVAVLAVTAAVSLASCAVRTAPARRPGESQAACLRVPAAPAAVLTGAPDAVTGEAGRQLLACSPVVVVARDGSRASVTRAAGWARRARAPLLLLPAGPGPVQVPDVLRAQIRALHPHILLAAGVVARTLAARLPGIRAVTGPARLPAAAAPRPRDRVVLLVPGRRTAATVAVAATARAAGARVIAVRGFDPRADPAAITALAAARPQRVLAVGRKFGPAGRLAARVAVAATGVQLPGGGQLVVPMHRLVALYGHPGAPALGVLGQQDLRAAIARARQAAALYRPLSRVPVVPAFEIIATVAEAKPGWDGSYSYETPVASLRPWVSRAVRAGLYVILDLQPGRASLLAQARKYRPLLKLADVGLALDPEWKLGPDQRPLRQIGSVGISEVNSVVRWLARLTARRHLPQKLLVLHQFQLSMIRGENRLDSRNDDLAIVIHMDGQGTPADKQQTWLAVTAAAPPGVRFGWKNFLVKDHPMLSPPQTMARIPQPVMISYQ